MMVSQGGAAGCWWDGNRGLLALQRAQTATGFPARRSICLTAVIQLVMLLDVLLRLMNALLLAIVLLTLVPSCR